MVEAGESVGVRVFALSHRSFPPEFPSGDGKYFPVQCGSAAGRLPGFSAYDDAPGCMSDFNWCFSEATGIKRVVSDMALWDGAEYLGFCHYRRYLEFGPADLAPGAVLCSRFGIGGAVIRQYAACHPLGAYVRFLNGLRRVDPALAGRIDKYFSESDEFYRANCFVAPRAVFEEYAAFVGKVWPVMASVVLSGAGLSPDGDRYQARYMSFLFERLTSFWLASECGAEKKHVPLVDLDVSNRENSTR